MLQLEQAKLHAQAHRAKIIVNKAGELIDYDTYLGSMGEHLPEAGAMLNVYPDSIGGTLGDLVEFVNDLQVAGAFTSAYVLPSIFNTDLDRGFSVIDYGLSEWYASEEDLAALAGAGISLKLDFILNHASVLSPQFQDLLAKGERSVFKDFFIDWNAFWAGHGEMTDEGYVQPDASLIEDMFFRKPGLPILMVRMPDGSEKPYWNTFYQEVRYTAPDAQDLMKVAGLQYTSAPGARRPGPGGARRGHSTRRHRLHRFRGGRRRRGGLARGAPQVSRPDGLEHRVAPGLGVLRGHARPARWVGAAIVPAGVASPTHPSSRVSATSSTSREPGTCSSRFGSWPPSAA